jgi:hypothetical protein
MLSEAHKAMAKEIGNGSLSKGLRIAIEKTIGLEAPAKRNDLMFTCTGCGEKFLRYSRRRTLCDNCRIDRDKATSTKRKQRAKANKKGVDMSKDELRQALLDRAEDINTASQLLTKEMMNEAFTEYQRGAGLDELADTYCK